MNGLIAADSISGIDVKNKREKKRVRTVYRIAKEFQLIRINRGRDRARLGWCRY